MTTPDNPVDITSQLRRMLGDATQGVQRDYDELYKWMITEGKNPRRSMGIKSSTAENYIERLDQLHRFVIDHLEPDDLTQIQDDDAHTIVRLIDQGEITKYGKKSDEEYSESAKRKFANALEKYFQWRYHEGDLDYEWEPKIGFSDGNGESAYRFKYRELGLIFEEAQSYGSLPSYYDTPEAKRDKIKGLVAQRLGKAKEDVTRDDWLHADWSNKVHSMVTVGYDVGMAPKEVANAEVHWYDPKTQTFTIPSEYACKERNKEQVALADDTADALSEWLQERRHLSKYDGSNNIWLNRDGNPYGSGSLCRLLRNLCDEAGIKTADRKIVWYSLRKTMGQKVTDAGDLSEANDQLRHDRLETTQEDYNQTPVEKLQARLNETREIAKKAASDPEYNPYEEEDESPPTQARQKQTGASQTTNGRSTPRPQPATGEEKALTRMRGGAVHANVAIPDTPEARSDLATRILNEDPDE